MAQVFANRYYVPSVTKALNPLRFVDNIRAPVFLACQWTDEQTGGHCPDLASHFSGTRSKWFTFTNGVHADSLDPLTLVVAPGLAGRPGRGGAQRAPAVSRLEG